MADTKTTGLTALTSTATGDLLNIVDVSDTTMAAAGTNKKITVDNLIGYTGAALYETGTWTPVLIGSSTAGSLTYTFQNGIWTRVGRVYHVNFRLRVNTSSVDPVGEIRVTGLPATALTDTDSAGALSFLDGVTGLNQVLLRVVSGETVIRIANFSGTSTAAIDDTDVSAFTSFHIRGSVTYQAA